MSDLIKRLRQHALPDPHDERPVLHANLLTEAADEQERLQKLVGQMDKQLGQRPCQYQRCLQYNNLVHDNLALSVIATKYCPQEHHDWQELLNIVKRTGKRDE